MKNHEQFRAVGDQLAGGRVARLAPSLITGVLVLAASCGRSSPANREISSDTYTSCPQPVRIAVMQDKTGSAKKTRTPQLEVGDLHLLFDLLRRCGGELRLGTVSDDADETLLPLRVPEPVTLRTRSVDRRKGSILRLVEKQEIAKERARIEAGTARWHAEAEAAIEEFLSTVEKLLLKSPSAQRSEIIGAIRRADLFLAEPEAGFSRASRRYLLAITDGVHTAETRGERLVLRSGATLIVVNGEGSLGVLEPLSPLRFEGVEAALRYIATNATAVNPEANVAGVRDSNEAR